MIILDTSVLSAAFRRRKRGPIAGDVATRLRDLVLADHPLAIPGIVFQEVLSGIPIPSQVAALSDDLAGFPLILATREHHVNAAQISNACRAAGIQVGAADALIAATTLLAKGRLFTLDDDFALVAKHCPLALYSR